MTELNKMETRRRKQSTNHTARVMYYNDIHNTILENKPKRNR